MNTSAGTTAWDTKNSGDMFTFSIGSADATATIVVGNYTVPASQFTNGFCGWQGTVVVTTG